MNYYNELVKEIAGNEIEAIVFNDKLIELSKNLDGIVPEKVPELPVNLVGIALTMEQARPFLDYEITEYETFGYHPFVAWTANSVITVVGDLPRIISLPRNPDGGWNVEW